MVGRRRRRGRTSLAEGVRTAAGPERDSLADWGRGGRMWRVWSVQCLPLESTELGIHREEEEEREGGMPRPLAVE